MTIIASYQFEIFADYHQFYLEDEAATLPDPEWAAFYDSEAVRTHTDLVLSGSKEAADQYWIDNLAQKYARLTAKDDFTWTEQSVADMLAAGRGKLGISTVRNFNVPVTVVIRTMEPQDSFETWDHVAEASIEVPSGRIVVTEPTGSLPDALRIPVEPGTYRARIFYGLLDKIDEMGFEGEDHYRVVLWPRMATSPHVLKRWKWGRLGREPHSK